MAASSADPTQTKQWAGHLSHKKLMQERETERRLRHGLDGKKQRRRPSRRVSS